MNNDYEAYSVILEEVDEFWAEVKLKARLRNKDRMLSELVQIAAMSQKTAEDVLGISQFQDRVSVVAGLTNRRSIASFHEGYTHIVKALNKFAKSLGHYDSVSWDSLIRLSAVCQWIAEDQLN